MTKREKLFGEEKVPKCQYCSNRLIEGTIENFLVVWTSTDLNRPDILAGGDICTPCCEEKKKEVEKLLKRKPE